MLPIAYKTAPIVWTIPPRNKSNTPVGVIIFHNTNNAITTVNGIRDYVQNHFSHIQNQTAMIIVNGVVLGSTAISNILTSLGNKKSE